MYKKLLGISEIEPGYKVIRISPMPIDTLDWVKGHYESVYGTISVSWKMSGNVLSLKVSIPVNCKAFIGFPDGREVQVVGSGEYVFE